MKTKEELHQDFLNEFTELLRKYDAEFNIDFRTESYSHKDVPVIDFNGIYEEGKEREYSQLDLPSYIAP